MYILTLNATFWSFQYINALLLVDNFYASFDKFLDKHLKLDHYRQQYTTACYDEKKNVVFCFLHKNINPSRSFIRWFYIH